MPINEPIPKFDIGQAPIKGKNLDDVSTSINANDSLDDNPIATESNLVDTAGTKFNAKIHKDPALLTPKGRFKKLPKGLNNADSNDNTGEAIKDFVVNYFKDYVADQVEPQTEFANNPLIDKVLIDNVNDYLDRPNNLLDKTDLIHPLVYILGAVGIYAFQASQKNKTKTERIKEYLKEKSARFAGFKAYIKTKFKRGK